MKICMIILLVSVLLTGCYSYKKVDLQQAEFKKGDKYKINRIDKPTQKGKFHSINDSLIILQGQAGEMHLISLKEIEKIKRRKFSLGKTIALPVGVIVITAGVSIVVNDGFGLGTIDLGY